MRIEKTLKSQRELAKLIDKTPGYVSEMLKGAPIGENAARTIEQKLGKPAAWLDVDRGEPRPLQSR